MFRVCVSEKQQSVGSVLLIAASLPNPTPQYDVLTQAVAVVVSPVSSRDSRATEAELSLAISQTAASYVSPSSSRLFFIYPRSYHC